jgi:hypothetical protein
MFSRTKAAFDDDAVTLVSEPPGPWGAKGLGLSGRTMPAPPTESDGTLPCSMAAISVKVLNDEPVCRPGAWVAMLYL